MKKIVILFSGEGSNMQALIQKLHNKELKVVKTITNNPNANGIDRSYRLGVDVEIVDHTKYKSREDFDRELVRIISDLDVDLVVLAGFMRILTPIFTKNLKAINIHPSLLPKFKGANALERAFRSDDDIVGVTTHFVSDELDGGKIIMQKSFDKSGMSFSEYEQNIHLLEHEIYYKSILKVFAYEKKIKV